MFFLVYENTLCVYDNVNDNENWQRNCWFRLWVRTVVLHENEDDDENKAARLLVEGYRLKGKGRICYACTKTKTKTKTYALAFFRHGVGS